MNYNSTRDKSRVVTASQAIAQGISEEGGLFVPQEFPKYSLEEIKAIESFGGSDAAYITLADIPVIDSIGVIGDNVHSKDEYIDLDRFSLATKRIAVSISHI